jgi:hypothetical protein
VRLSVTVSQRDVSCSAEALITVTDSLGCGGGPFSVPCARLTGLHV